MRSRPSSTANAFAEASNVIITNITAGRGCTAPRLNLLCRYKTAAYKDLASRAEKSQNLHSLAAQLALKRQLMVRLFKNSRAAEEASFCTGLFY